MDKVITRADVLAWIELSDMIFVKESASYRDDNPNKSYYIKWTDFGDYIGSSIGEANYQYFIETFPTFVKTGNYAYSTKECIIYDSEIVDNMPDIEDFMDTVISLEDYPVVDDELMSKIEYERQLEFVQEYIIPDIYDKSVDEINETYGPQVSADILWALDTFSNETWLRIFEDYNENCDYSKIPKENRTCCGWSFDCNSCYYDYNNYHDLFDVFEIVAARGIFQVEMSNNNNENEEK